MRSYFSLYSSNVGELLLTVTDLGELLLTVTDLLVHEDEKGINFALGLLDPV